MSLANSKTTNLQAIVRRPCPEIAQCALTYIERSPIHFETLKEQHRHYCETLKKLGLSVKVLPEDSSHPDSVFVEDPAVIFDEMAFLNRLGVPSRQGETLSLREHLSPYRSTHQITPPGTLEGGDVLQVDRKVFVGISKRTNLEAIEQIQIQLKSYDYEVIPLELKECLHLKTACTYIGQQTFILNPQWVRKDFFCSAFPQYKALTVHPSEPFAANTIKVGHTLITSASAPQTNQSLIAKGFSIQTLDISEVEKAEGGLTCLSLIFKEGL